MSRYLAPLFFFKYIIILLLNIHTQKMKKNDLLSVEKSISSAVSFIIIAVFCYFPSQLNAQEIRVIDNKGTIKNVTINTVSTSITEPTNPVAGDVWFDMNTNISKVWEDGSPGTWRVIDTDIVTTAAAAPPSPKSGDIWFDNSVSSNVLTKVYDGVGWLPINTTALQDADGDTKITFEKNIDEDIIRFSTGNTTANRQVLRIDNPGIFSSTELNSAVLGIEANTSSDFDARLRITAGNNDTFNDTQGASIDLHGNNTTENTGRVDLVAGSAASNGALAFTVWGNDGTSPTPTSEARIVMTGKGNVGIGNTAPNAEAILDLTNSQKLALILPQETETTAITTPSEGMLLHSTNKKNTYLYSDNLWKPVSHNIVTNELIFDGDDDADITNDNYYYVSLIINGKWKVIRYNKTDVNAEDTADITTNPSQTSQPTTLAVCASLF